MALPSSLTASKANAIETAERVSSVFSVAGAGLIIITFLLDQRFRKPINRLVFYASWGNLFANVATLISREGIKAGLNAPLCQFQAFLIQWFMPADALFTFAMACNVYLTFFKQHDAASLRTLEWRYLALCYGLPFIPALVFVFIDVGDSGRVYGSANLWCWISSDYKYLRIGAFYGPVWVIILFDLIIYFKVGLVVMKWRRSLVGSSGRGPSPAPGLGTPARPTYEVNVVSQVPHSRTRSIASQKRFSNTINLPRSPVHTRVGSEVQFNETPVHVNTTIRHQPSVRSQRRVVDANRAALQYCYTACLFSFALIVTWVPSTVNRLYTLVQYRSQSSPFGLDLASGLLLPLQGFWNTIIYIVTSWAACRSLWDESIGSCCIRRRKDMHPGVKLEDISTDASGSPTKSAVKDPYPLSPASTSTWPFREDVEKHDRSGTTDADSLERADIVMSLDARGKVVRQGRKQFDWGPAPEEGSSIVALPDRRDHYGGRTTPRDLHSPVNYERRSQYGGRTTPRDLHSPASYSSLRSHSRQASGHIIEQMRGSEHRY